MLLERREGKRAQPGEPPPIAATGQAGFHQRAGQPLEQPSTQPVQPLAAGTAEEETQAHRIAGEYAASGELRHEFVETGQFQIDQRLAGQLVEGFHAGLDPLPPRLGQQRDIVAGAEIVEATAQVDDMGGVIRPGSGFERQIVVGGDQVVTGIVRAPVGESVDHDTKAGHEASLTERCQRPNIGSPGGGVNSGSAMSRCRSGMVALKQDAKRPHGWL